MDFPDVRGVARGDEDSGNILGSHPHSTVASLGMPSFKRLKDI